MATHVRVLAWLNIAMGFLGVGLALIVFAGGTILPSIIQHLAEDPDFPVAILQLVFTVITGVILTLSLPCLVVGFGLYNFRPWGRVLGLVLAALNLLNIPFGTAMSLYAFWVLLKPETEALFKNQAVSPA